MVSLGDSYSWCQRLSKQTAGNFYFAFWTLPPGLFRDMCVLYAFMRVSDDLGDDDRMPVANRANKIVQWRTSLTQALTENRFDHPVFPALADIIRRHQIPHEYFYTVIEGVESDLQSNGFESFDELREYCYQVAGVVGLCCIHIWGFHDDRAISRAIDCGVAFQLTNILRDLGEDSAMGRVYLPREDLLRFGYTPEDLAAHQRDERFCRLMEFEVARAKHYYESARTLFDYLEPPGKPILSAMLQIYGGLLHEIQRRDFDVFSSRISLPRWRKVLISLKGSLGSRWFRTGKQVSRTPTSEP